MPIKIFLAIAALVFSTTSFTSALVFDKAGFEIDALDSSPGAAGLQALIMMLPAEDGFAANVNVQIQPYGGTLAEYKKLSDSQFSQMAFKVSTSIIEKNILKFEYTGSMSNLTLHWYSLAIKKGDFIYLVIATSLDKNWPKNKAALVASVDSLKLK